MGKRSHSLIINVEEADLSPEDLETLATDILSLANKKRALSPVKQIQQSIQNLKGQYDKIESGSSWKDEQTSSAVKELEKLDYQYIFQEILNISEVDQRWNLAILMNEVVTGIIFDAEDWGGKQVNGSMGEWCPEAGKSLEKFWSKLLETTSTNPSNDILIKVEKCIVKSLGDYGDLSFVSKKYPSDKKNDVILESIRGTIIDLCN